MNNLKELTKEQHKNAERSRFVKSLIKGEITKYQYYVYLSNQFIMYSVLEDLAQGAGILDDIQEIKRSVEIAKDLKELEIECNFDTVDVLLSTQTYVKYLNKISDNPDKLLAHLYVRHMGDLSGGQIIKRFVPGSGNHYNFSCDVNELKEKFRLKLHDGLADEAKVCFDMIGIFLTELEKFLDMGKTD
jgi:heme oxygenase (biliverdin-producing, ferredoxin)